MERGAVSWVGMAGVGAVGGGVAEVRFGVTMLDFRALWGTFDVLWGDIVRAPFNFALGNASGLARNMESPMINHSIPELLRASMCGLSLESQAPNVVTLLLHPSL